MKFSEKLQKFRKEKGYSQEQLADLLEVSRQSVSKWESGTTYPEMDKLLMLCKIFNVTLDDLTNDDITDKAIKEKNKGTFNNFIYALMDVINKSIEMFKSMTKKELMKCISEMLILFVILLIFNIPFHYINNLAQDIFRNFGAAYSITNSIWNFFTSIIYLVLVITVLLYVYKSRYLDKFDYTRVEKENEDKLIEESEIKREEKTKKEKHNFILFDVLGSLFNFFVKFCLIIMLIPTVVILFALIFSFVLSFILLLKGVFYPGILVTLIGASILCGLVLEIIIRFLVNAEFKFKRLFWIFVGSLIVCSIGAGVTTFEIAETEYIDEAPVTEEIITKSVEYEYNENLIIDNYYSYYLKNIIYEVDESLTDKVVFDLNYYDKYTNVSIENIDNKVTIRQYDASSVFRNSYNLLIDNLKDKIIYDYSLLSEVNVVVKSSSNNIEVLKKNYDKYVKEMEEKIELEKANSYYITINTLSDENEELRNQLMESEEKITELEEKIREIENLIK